MVASSQITKPALCIVIGTPIAHSLSPALHNEGYRALGIDGQFSFAACEVKPELLSNALLGVRALGIRGVAVTLPHKVASMELVDVLDASAKSAGALNTIVQEGDLLHGYNTDIQGVRAPLLRRTSLKDKKVAIIGAGGAARSAVSALVSECSSITIFNRSSARAVELATSFGINVAELTSSSNFSNYDIVIQATSVGMSPAINLSPAPNAIFKQEQIVFDLIYSPRETLFLKKARAAGAEIIFGSEMFTAQAAAQFKLFTGKEVPIALLEDKLEKIAAQK